MNDNNTRPADEQDFFNALNHIDRMIGEGKPQRIIDRLASELAEMRRTGIFVLR